MDIEEGMYIFRCKGILEDGSVTVSYDETWVCDTKDLKLIKSRNKIRLESYGASNIEITYKAK